MSAHAALDAARAALADLVAFTALPATWVGASTRQVAESLADVLHRALHARAVAVLLRDERANTVVARRGDDPRAEAALRALREGRPHADGPATATMGVGPMGARGGLVAVCDEPGFPSEGQRLLLVLAANQADTALREAALDHQMASVQQQLVKLEKLAALGQVVSGVAHEIRTPLTYASSNLHLARARLAATSQDPAAPAPDVDRFLAEAADAMDRINGLVAQLRRYSSPVAMQRVEAPLSRVVEQAVRLFRATHAGPVTVSTSLQAEGLVEVDVVQVQQVVINVLQNAVEAMPRGGHVVVGTRDEPAAVSLVVEDDGPGIPDEIRARVFDPFFTTKATGTGLGLSIVRRILDSHRAQLDVDSGPAGTRFTVRFHRASLA